VGPGLQTLAGNISNTVGGIEVTLDGPGIGEGAAEEEVDG
jgi:hypothetical protein